MVQQTQNLVRPRTVIVENKNKKSKNSILVLSLIATCIFLLVLCVCLVSAIVLVGRNLSNNSESLKKFTKNNNQLVESSIINEQLINTSSSNNIRLKSVNNLFVEKLKNNLTKSEVKFKILNLSTGESEINTIMSTPRVTGIISKVLDKLTYRLPEGVLPKLYNLHLNPDLINEKFSGNVSIHLEVTKPMSFIAVHTKKLNITDTKLFKKQDDNITLNNVEIKQTYEYEPYEYWVTELENVIDVGNYMLNIHFDGSLANRIVGLYQSTYLDKNTNRTRVIATSKFEPTYARQAFPCFDEPGMKAEFEISLIRPTDDGYSALSNMEVKEEILNEGNLTTTVNFYKSVPMSTYLACFIVSDFVFKEANVSSVNINNTFQLRVFATPAQLNKVDFALETGKKVTEYYIDYFNIKYPLNKLDMVAIPDFVSGAMEHWGLVTFRETALLYDNKTSSTINKQRVATVIAHELAHQWFGNLVTMAWWNELWLNEGFASYIEYKGTHEVYPEWGMMDQFLIDDLHSVLSLDGTLASHPIVQTVTNPDQITEIFDAITYNKGAAVIRMLEDFVGAENFRTAVTHYLEKFAYKNAETYDLLNEIDNLGDGLDVKNIMDTWTRQMGLPYVTVENISETEYKITQKRFLLNPDSENMEQTPSDYNYRWFIPLTYYTDTKNITGRQWFPNTDSSVTIQVKDAHRWIKFNRDQIGYYRVLYPEAMWTTFRESLIENISVLSISDRANLLNDAFNFADATLLPYHIAMDLTKFLSEEKDYVPWAVASSKFYTIFDLFYGSSDIYSKFKEYGKRIITKSYESVNWTISDRNSDHLENRLRTVVLNFACTMGLQQCKDEVKTRFNKWIENPEDRPHPDIRNLIYHHGMAIAGDETKWEIMWKLFVDETDAQEKLKLMNGLAAIEDMVVLNKFLDLAKDSTKIRSQDYFTCLQYIASNKYGESLVWDFVRNNWLYLVDRFTVNDRYLGRMVQSITSNFNTEVKLDDMKHFFEKYPDAGAGTTSRAQALERVVNNIKWLENNKESIGNWLDQNQM